MRKLAANLLLFSMLAIFLAPALAASVPMPVPACCRRGGQHHCMATSSVPAQSGFRSDSRCPMRMGAQLCSLQAALAGFSGSQFLLNTHRSSFLTSSGAILLIARAANLRGPPAVLA